MQTAISPDLNQVNWYGRGPHENYSDRKTSARIGLYSYPVQDLHFDYIRPQENGYRTDVRYAAFVNEKGKGFRISGTPSLCIGAQYYSKSQYCSAAWPCYNHPYDLEKENNISLNIDHKQMGVGGDNSWGAEAHKEYRILPHEYYWSFILSPE